MNNLRQYDELAASWLRAANLHLSRDLFLLVAEGFHYRDKQFYYVTTVSFISATLTVRYTNSCGALSDLSRIRSTYSIAVEILLQILAAVLTVI